MTKSDYFNELQSFFNESISSDLVKNQTTSENLLTFGIPRELVAEISEKEILNYFEELIANCEKKLESVNKSKSKILYIWFDEMIGLINVNILPSRNEMLPFKASVMRVNLEEIISHFYTSPYRHGIPLEDFEEHHPENEPEVIKENIVKVFYKVI